MRPFLSSQIKTSFLETKHTITGTQFKKQLPNCMEAFRKVYIPEAAVVENQRHVCKE